MHRLALEEWHPLDRAVVLDALREPFEQRPPDLRVGELTAPELHRDLFRRDQSDLDGTFTLQGIVPGRYTVLAIEGGWELDWSEREPAIFDSSWMIQLRSPALIDKLE